MLEIDFFQRDVLVVARELIGIELVWRGCSGLIVETEAYAVEGDLACHTAIRPSSRKFVQDHPAGTAYVYFNYGMYWMFNLLVKGGPHDGLILVRALQPIEGVDAMKQRRNKERLEDLCSGPGKLAQALGIAKEDHCTPMVGSSRPPGVGLRRPRSKFAHAIAEDIRVGIRPAADFPWRFLALDNSHVSVPHGKVKPMPPLRPRSRRARG